MKKLTIRQQFRIGAGLILFFFWASTSFLVYLHGKKQIEQAVYKETEFYIAAVEATRTYVKEVLRPKMYEILPGDHFIAEAMSTSFVGRDIMARINARFPYFAYKRAALKPMNSDNRADSLEQKMIGRFGRDPNLKEWSGIVEKDGEKFYTRFRAIYAEHECLHCHGEAEDVPAVLIERYGERPAGAGYAVGEVVAADSIYIPVGFSISKIKKQAWLTFFVGGGLLLLLLFLFHALFNYTVIAELQGLLTVFKRIGRKEVEAPELHPGSMDEIDQLKAAFEQTARELKTLHGELQESESKFRRLFATSRDPIFIWGINRRFVDINTAGLNLFRFTDKQEALSIETVEQLFWDARDGMRLLAALQDRGFVKDYEVSLVNRHGDHLHGLVTATLFHDENNRPAGFEGTIRDITERKRLEKHLARTEKLAAVGQLAAGLAHEVNNPLSVISCYAKLIDKSGQCGPEARRDLEVIRRHTSFCKKIIEDLLNFARVSETRKMAGDIRRTMETVLALVEKQFGQKHIEVHRRFARDLPPIVFDRDKIKQVFLNLLMNAVQAIEAEGSITVRIDRDPLRHTLVVEIDDTGSGISEANLDLIFNPFFTTKKTGEGTGLGLSISYGIIREHGGDIQVRSMPGRGTVFTVLLPLDANAEEM